MKVVEPKHIALAKRYTELTLQEQMIKSEKTRIIETLRTELEIKARGKSKIGSFYFVRNSMKKYYIKDVFLVPNACMKQVLDPEAVRKMLDRKDPPDLEDIGLYSKSSITEYVTVAR